METKNKKKTFDAVKMMRDVRDRISDETQGMSLQEFQKYITEKLKNSGFKAIHRKS
ncbi:MAG: hypothetical protein WD824_10250 [Cyclobacteriaceae bacterium]